VTDADLTRASREQPTLLAAHCEILDRLASMVDQSGTRSAMDAHFLATGRLNSLTRQLEALFLLALLLANKEACNKMKSALSEEPATVVLRHATTELATRPTLALDTACAFIQMHDCDEEETGVPLLAEQAMQFAQLLAAGIESHDPRTDMAVSVLSHMHKLAHLAAAQAGDCTDAVNRALRATLPAIEAAQADDAVAAQLAGLGAAWGSLYQACTSPDHTLKDAALWLASMAEGGH